MSGTEPNHTHTSGEDEIMIAVEELHELAVAVDQAFDLAVGVWADDAEHPSVVAIVRGGRLVGLEINDSVCTLPHDTAEALVNAVVINAFIAWNESFIQASTGKSAA